MYMNGEVSFVLFYAQATWQRRLLSGTQNLHFPFFVLLKSLSFGASMPIGIGEARKLSILFDFSLNFDSGS